MEGWVRICINNMEAEKYKRFCLDEKERTMSSE